MRKILVRMSIFGELDDEIDDYGNILCSVDVLEGFYFDAIDIDEVAESTNGSTEYIYGVSGYINCYKSMIILEKYKVMWTCERR